MQRPIASFLIDTVGDPIAVLSCGHRQHVRHKPPLSVRPWAVTEQGRLTMVGKPLDCVRCDRFEMPSDFVPYKKTPLFTEHTVPAGLLKDHATKRGVWAHINVVEGRLRYRVETLHTDTELTVARAGIVVPEVLHCVEPQGPVQFFVEFYRAPAPTPERGPP